MTEKELFEQLVTKNLDLLCTREEIKEILSKAKEADFEKEELALIKAAAVLHAKASFEETKAKNEALVETYERLTA
jgi:hypothetical protein